MDTKAAPPLERSPWSKPKADNDGVSRWSETSPKMSPGRVPEPPSADKQLGPPRNPKATSPPTDQRPKYVVFSNSKRSLPAAVAVATNPSEPEEHHRGGRGKSGRPPSKAQILKDKCVDLENRLAEADAECEQRLEEARYEAYMERLQLMMQHVEDVEQRERAHLHTEEEGETKMYRMHYGHLKYLWSRINKERKLMYSREYRKRDYLLRLEEQRRELLTMKFATAVMLHWKDETHNIRIKELHRVYNTVPTKVKREEGEAVRSVANIAEVINTMIHSRDDTFAKEQLDALATDPNQDICGFEKMVPMAEKLMSHYDHTSIDPAYEEFDTDAAV
mmetsp:Transcript_99910/g.172298  ORF Transcript_99910/g.172298 Transcript_99910/m.172298 type:complete len:334 (-) Transcript_99910:847-1848(-)